MENLSLSFNIPGIMKCQQNRYPMLFIDKVTECVPLKYAKGYKLFSYNEWYFHKDNIIEGTLLFDTEDDDGMVVINTFDELEEELQNKDLI